MNNKTTAGLIIKQLNINNNNRFNNFRNKKIGKVYSYMQNHTNTLGRL